MRQIGTLSSEAQARRFVDFLTVQGVRAQSEHDQGNGTWDLWVRDEDALERARDALKAFHENPLDPRFEGVESKADELRHEQIQRQQQARKNVVEMRGQWNRPTAKRIPLLLTLIGLCILVSLMSSSMTTREISNTVYRKMLFADPALFLVMLPDFQPSGWTNIMQGEVWRLVTPIFIHFGPAHLIMNLFALYFAGSQIESRRGPLMFAMLVLFTAVISNISQYVFPIMAANPPTAGDFLSSIRFGGISGVVFGLFGYIWLRRRIDPGCGYLVNDQTMLLLVALIVLGFAGLFDYVGLHLANWAHAAGLVAGMVAALAADASRQKRA